MLRSRPLPLALLLVWVPSLALAAPTPPPPSAHANNTADPPAPPSCSLPLLPPSRSPPPAPPAEPPPASLPRLPCVPPHAAILLSLLVTRGRSSNLLLPQECHTPDGAHALSAGPRPSLPPSAPPPPSPSVRRLALPGPHPSTLAPPPTKPPLPPPGRRLAPQGPFAPSAPTHAPAATSRAPAPPCAQPSPVLGLHHPPQPSSALGQLHLPRTSGSTPAPSLPPQRPWARSPGRLSSLRSSARATPSGPTRTAPLLLPGPEPPVGRAASPDYSPLSSPGSSPPLRPTAAAGRARPASRPGCSSDPLDANDWSIDPSPSPALLPHTRLRDGEGDDDPFYDLLDYDDPPRPRRRPLSPSARHDTGAPPSRRQRRRSALESPPADPPFVLPHPLPADHPARWGRFLPPALHTRGGPTLRELIPPHNDLFRPRPGDPPHPQTPADSPSPLLNPFVALPTDFVFHIANLFAALYDDPDPRGHLCLPNYSRAPKLIRHGHMADGGEVEVS
ncbi:hypothetical protein AB1Y20_001841 [Prymnesium parvum]|uniref:Mannosyltransferase n=1 Tax=Prymnesium parvum TaxID=97485 RepID=A0AB34KEQ1_PRYPA